MATSNFSSRSSGPVLSNSQSERFRVSSSTSTTAFASASSSFATRSCRFFGGPTSPKSTINLCGSARSVWFSTESSLSPRSCSIAVSQGDEVRAKKQNNPLSATSSARKTCMCSPTNHPGSFRCSLHKNVNNHHHHHQERSYPSSHRLNARRSAMTNSLVRIGTVEGELIKRALAALIRPSSHQQKRRASFQPRPSRLSLMSKAEGL